jgi:hypothetical protein
VFGCHTASTTGERDKVGNCNDDDDDDDVFLNKL